MVTGHANATVSSDVTRYQFLMKIKWTVPTCRGLDYFARSESRLVSRKSVCQLERNIFVLEVWTYCMVYLS